MATTMEADICVIGAGSGGLSVAAGAARLGAATILIEESKMGGDCLNVGCVPSKALLAAAHAAAHGRAAAAMGVRFGAPEIDFAAVRAHVQGVIAGIAPHDSVERFEGLGVRVIKAHARFVDPRTVEAGDNLVRARRFVIATGSSALVPPIPGLDAAPYLTNETLWDLDRLPARLVVLGGGPIGCELAQAFARFGTRVTLVEMQRLLPKDDAEAVEAVRASLVADGIEIHDASTAERVERASAGIAVHANGPAGPLRLEGSHLLIAAGRRANLAGLGLDAAGIAATPSGITVDRRLRTSNARVFAIGDAIGPPQFTHLAGYHAGIVIRNALFRLPAKVDLRALPWVTFTDPELAQVGLTEEAARAKQADVRVMRWPFADNDRARTERRTSGFVKAVTDARGRILGATIVGAEAGELIQPWALAMANNLRIGAMAQVILPYPTLGEANKRTAGEFYTASLFSPRTRWLVRLLARLS